MANLLGKNTWGRRSSYARSVDAKASPYRTNSGQRLREKKQWNKDWFQETAPNYPEWISLIVDFMYERNGW